LKKLIFLGGLAFFCSQLSASILTVSTSLNTLGFYDTLANTFTPIGTISGATSGPLLGLGVSGGVLYGTDGTATPSLYAIDGTAATTTIGTTLGTAAGTMDGDALYFADSTDSLFSVNTSLGTATLVGTVGSLGIVPGDINFGPDGNLYDITGGELYKINTSLGTTTDIGATGQTFDSIASGDNLLYGFTHDGTNVSVYSIDLTTGAAGSPIQSVAFTGSFLAESSGPEPGTFVLLFGGLAVAVPFARRRLKRG
jgi:hypothetical protein